MNLPMSGREFYDPRPSTIPPVDGWEASFDGGETFVPAEIVETFPKWMVRGPLAEDHETITTTEITALTVPIVRSVGEDDEILVRKAPRIQLV